MYEKYAALVQWRSNLAQAERFEDLAREFVLPLVMYLGNRMVVVRTRDDLIALLMRLQRVRRQKGVAQVLSSVSAVELARNGRFRLWARHHELDDLGRSISYSDAVYYCCETPQGLKTEMAEFAACALPDLWDAAPKPVQGQRSRARLVT